MHQRFIRRLAATVFRARETAFSTTRPATAMLAVSIAMAACSTNNVLDVRPAVDVGSHTSAVSLAPPPAAPVSSTPPPAATQTWQDSSLAVAGGPPYLTVPDAGQPAAGIKTRETAETEVAMVAPPGSGLPLVIDEPAPEPGIAPGPEVMPEASAPAPVHKQVRPAPVQKQERPAPVLAAYPRLNRPEPPPALPSDEAACRRELRALGVRFTDLPPIRDSASCGIDHPVKVSVLPGKVALKPAATLSCQMALAFAKWTKEELNPAARARYWSRVATIHQMSSYSCRRINGSRTMSQHSKGNAIDIGRIVLANGKDIEVEKPGLFSFRTKGFLNNVRKDGCSYFNTVLGPGYNYDHRNHFHFDIMPRRNGRVACH